MGRTIAIGDIHGHSVTLVALLDAIKPRPADTVVTLGDYIDIGPDSKGVLTELIALAGRCRLVPLLGNHEEMLLNALAGGSPDTWLKSRGNSTLKSYGIGNDLKRMPTEHLEFFRSLQPHYESETHLFVHANYAPNLPLDRTNRLTKLWLPLNEAPNPHYSGKTVILGHTPQPDLAALDRGHVVCIDTGCGYGGCLTALELDSGTVWQADELTSRVDCFWDWNRKSESRMTKRIETRIFVVRDGELRPAARLLGRKPFVGIWWQDERTLVAIGEPTTKAYAPFRLVDSNLEHVQEWPTIAAAFGMAAESDYFEIPRGRVLWDPTAGRGIIYHGNATTPENLKLLGRIFHLRSWQHHLDEHYLMGRSIERLFDDA